MKLFTYSIFYRSDAVTAVVPICTIGQLQHHVIADFTIVESETEISYSVNEDGVGVGISVGHGGILFERYEIYLRSFAVQTCKCYQATDCRS